MRCPACGAQLPNGAWMCQACEYIVDASFLGGDVTDQPSSGGGFGFSTVSKDDRPPFDPADAPTGGLDVDSKMIESEEEPSEPVTEDIPVPKKKAGGLPKAIAKAPKPVSKEVRPLSAPEEKGVKDTNVLPDQVLPSAPKPLDPMHLEELQAPVAEPKPMVIGEKRKGLPKLDKKQTPAEESKQRELLARAMSRGPIQEKKKGEEKPVDGPRPAVRLRQKTEDLPSIPQPVVRVPKAEKIFQQALEDIAAGSLNSARTNLKLAITFDPGNERYIAKLEEVSVDEPQPSQDLEDVPKGVQAAHEFYEKAVDAENQGNFDGAAKLLQKAIRADPQGVYYNQLGMILAFKLNDLKEGRRMIEKAIQVSPRNKKYQKNLGKILEKLGVGSGDRKDIAGMLGGLLNKRK